MYYLEAVCSGCITDLNIGTSQLLCNDRFLPAITATLVGVSISVRTTRYMATKSRQNLNT